MYSFPLFFSKQYFLKFEYEDLLLIVHYNISNYYIFDLTRLDELNDK